MTFDYSVLTKPTALFLFGGQLLIFSRLSLVSSLSSTAAATTKGPTESFFASYFKVRVCTPTPTNNFLVWSKISEKLFFYKKKLRIKKVFNPHAQKRQSFYIVIFQEYVESSLLASNGMRKSNSRLWLSSAEKRKSSLD